MPGKQKCLERNGIIELCFLGSEQQGHWPGSHGFDRMRQNFRFLLQFLQIAPSEFVPLRGVVVEPFTQFGAGSQFLEPQIDVGFLSGEAARPQPINQYPPAVVLRRAS